MDSSKLCNSIYHYPSQVFAGKYLHVELSSELVYIQQSEIPLEIIIPAVVGGLFFIVVLGFFIFCCVVYYYRRKLNKSTPIFVLHKKDEEMTQFPGMIKFKKKNIVSFTLC